MKITSLLILVVVAFGFTTFAPPKLSYKFKVGETYVWNQTAKQDIKQSIMGMDQSMENSTIAEMTFKVVELTKTGAKLETQYTKLKTAIKSPQMNTEMDSDGAQDKRENKLFKSLTNKPFFIFMTHQGKIDKIEGIDTLLSAYKDAGIDEATAAAFKSTLEQYMGAEGVKASVQKVFLTYPENPVKKGDTWKANHKTDVPFTMITDDTWSIAEVTDAVVNLTGEGVFVTDKEKEMSLPGGIKARVDLSGNQAMKSSVNAKTGWPTTSDALSEIKGKMILLAGGPIPEDMEMPMEIVSEVKSVITKK